MAVTEMKKGITIIMMMLMIIFVVNQVSDATQSIDACKYDCRLCEQNCVDACFSGGCIVECKKRNCPCCLRSSLHAQND
ncbi:Thionin-like protein [Medicago truncatula]|uniref:Thionin-like protein n=1 Tax=Medicago truncatula TaxID=3880 RepID=A0A072U2Q4_MEDTR|nr:Thionin-like protein [Medicago truncatula]